MKFNRQKLEYPVLMMTLTFFFLCSFGALADSTRAACGVTDNGEGPNTGIHLQAAFPELPKLNELLGLFQSPGDSSRWYAMLKDGSVYWFDNKPRASKLNLFISIVSQVENSGEQGLLGLAFHPEYSSNHELFLSYSNKSGDSVISRFTKASELPISIKTEQQIIKVKQPATNHNGGNIAFGPDGYLYIGFGDGGGAGDRYKNGQNTQTLLGSMLRINVDDSETYTVPKDNPFVGNAAFLPEIYAYGLRNPWRWSFDIKTAELWLADVGQNKYEEVDIIKAGKNYGWPIMEGKHCFRASSCDQQNLVLPIAEYDQSAGDCSITGGFVYRGQQVKALEGHFIYGDYCTGRILSTVKKTEQSYITTEIEQTNMSIGSFAQGLDGEVYILNTYGLAGEGIYRFADAASADNCR